MDNMTKKLNQEAVDIIVKPNFANHSSIARE